MASWRVQQCFARVSDTSCIQADLHAAGMVMLSDEFALVAAPQLFTQPPSVGGRPEAVLLVGLRPSLETQGLPRSSPDDGPDHSCPSPSSKLGRQSPDSTSPSFRVSTPNQCTPARRLLQSWAASLQNRQAQVSESSPSACVLSRTKAANAQLRPCLHRLYSGSHPDLHRHAHAKLHLEQVSGGNAVA